MIQLKNQLQYGTLRKNKSNGMSDYTIVGEDAVKHCLEVLRPHLKIKKRQATLLLQIIKQSQKEEEPSAFLTRCELVDQVSRLNDSKVSKQRKITSETVRSLFFEIEFAECPCRDSIGTGFQCSIREHQEKEPSWAAMLLPEGTAFQLTDWMVT